MRNKGTVVSAGFTIIEVMIVLSLTGLFIILAVGYVSGLISNNEFGTSIRSAEQQIVASIDEAENGNYLTKAFSCSGTSPSPPVITPGSSNTQGQNKGCILLGNVLQFNPNGNASSYADYPIIGLQYGNSGSDSLNLSQALPITFSTDGTTQTLDHGLTYHSLIAEQWDSSSFMPASAIGLIDGDEQGDLETNGGVNSGRANLSVFYLTSYDPASNNPITSELQPTREIELCLSSGTNNQSGQITIGGPEGGTGVSLTIFGDSTC